MPVLHTPASYYSAHIAFLPTLYRAVAARDLWAALALTFSACHKADT